MVDEQLTIEDEWTESADNVPEIPTDEDLWWARMLTEEEDEQC